MGVQESLGMNSCFRDLGRIIYDRWKEENFSLPAFPGIARDTLVEHSPAEQVDLPALIRDFLLEDEQPFQSSSGFGQPELIVYDNPRFYIQVLFWLEGTTDIHQHEFSGAFHVMAGSSIHSHFQFEDVQPITAHFRIGSLKLKETKLLETGSTVAISSGGGFIHSLFHLETPSITVVIRTHSDPGTGPQFTYLPPHLAVDPVQNDALTIRRKQLLDVLERTDNESYPELVRAMLGALDFERGFFILQNCIGHLRNLGEWDSSWEVFSQKHGSLAHAVAPTLEEILRRDAMAAMRGSIEDVEHRFFLALLLNLEDRGEILNMVAQRYPGDPVQTILRWSGELTDSSESGTWILDAQFPEELGIEDQPKLFLAALRYFLTGGKLPQLLKSLSEEDLETLRGAFKGSSLRALLLPE